MQCTCNSHAPFCSQRFNLGPDSTLVLNNLTDPTESFVSAGLETFPMVSSYPYPPQFM